MQPKILVGVCTHFRNGLLYVGPSKVLLHILVLALNSLILY